MPRKTIHGIDPYTPGGIEALLAHHRLTFGDAVMEAGAGWRLQLVARPFCINSWRVSLHSAHGEIWETRTCLRACTGRMRGTRGNRASTGRFASSRRRRRSIEAHRPAPRSTRARRIRRPRI